LKSSGIRRGEINLLMGTTLERALVGPVWRFIFMDLGIRGLIPKLSGSGIGRTGRDKILHFQKRKGVTADAVTP
jgi:hypothetical protein